MDNLTRKIKFIIPILMVSILAVMTRLNTPDKSNSLQGKINTEASIGAEDAVRETVDKSKEKTKNNTKSLEDNEAVENTNTAPKISVAIDSIPEYNGDPYIAINNNIPDFDTEELERARVSYEEYGNLDSLNRCTTAIASIGQDLMPTEKRGSIGQIKPTGWVTSKYEFIDGKYLYNRCHLIGYQLCGQNIVESNIDGKSLNLITGTRYMNVEGMLPFENMIANYVKDTNNHVLYRVTPVFKDDELLARGVILEAMSVEDNGEGIEFNVYVYNVQPGVEINYADGTNKEATND